MKETDPYSRNHSTPGHPDENELAQYAEYLRSNAGNLPEKLVRHVESCSYCRAELMAITDLLDELPDLAEEPLEDTINSPAFKRREQGARPGLHPGPLSIARHFIAGSRRQGLLSIARHFNAGSRQSGEVKGKVISWVRRPPFTRMSIVRDVAAVAAVFILVFAVVKIMPGRHEKVPMASNKVEKPAVAKDEVAREAPAQAKTGLTPDTVLYASAYTTNRVYENLIGAKFRSGTDPGVQGPLPGTAYAPGDTLRLNWTPEPGESYNIIIVDNKGTTAVEIKTGAVAKLAWKIDLKPGLYYWKFLSRDEMWHVGKFKVATSPR